VQGVSWEQKVSRSHPPLFPDVQFRQQPVLFIAGHVVFTNTVWLTKTVVLVHVAFTIAHVKFAHVVALITGQVVLIKTVLLTKIVLLTTIVVLVHVTLHSGQVALITVVVFMHVALTTGHVVFTNTV
jgi:hypothetical protein